MVIGGQRRRSTTVNAVGHRSTPAEHSGDRRSTVAVNDGRRWRTTIDCRWTTVDHHRTTGQCRRITVVIGGQRWRSTTVASGEPSLTATGPPLTTTEPP
nr:hypothetical protein [Tanacetum cinerariifolium]